MAGKESFFWHKMHSLTGVIPTGYYLAQHLALNSFSLGGARAFDQIIEFFEALPKHILYSLKAVIWASLIFHAVYGMFIVSRAQGNYSQAAFKYRENRYFTWQRWSGIFLLFFLSYHMLTTSVLGTLQGTHVIKYDTWADRLAAPGGTYLVLVFYALGVLASTYHFAYGIWNFCIRWGITISESAQMRMAKFSFGAFVALTGLGWAALAGFLFPVFEKGSAGEARLEAPVVVSAPISGYSPADRE